MLRAILLASCLIALVLGLSVPTFLSGQPTQEKQKRVAEQAQEYEYPKGKRFVEYNIGMAYQSVVTTSDDLETVEKWYRKKLALQPTTNTGVGRVTRILDPETAKARGFDVLSSLYTNNQKPKEGDPKQKVSQPATVWSYVVREVDHTLVVIVSHSKEEKATQVSVSFLCETSK